MQVPARAGAHTPRATSDRVAAAAAVLTMAVGATAFAGWWFHLPALTGFGGAVTMKANMAVALMACGIALRALVARRLPLVTVALAVVVSVIGGLTFLEHVSGADFGIDQLLFTEPPGAAATASPGRIGLNGSLALLLAGIALVLLSRNRRPATGPAQVIACVLLLFELLPIVGYVYGATELYMNPRVTGIAWPTAMTLLVLAVGLATARIKDGPLAIAVARGPGGVLFRRLLLPAFLVPVGLGFLQVPAERLQLVDSELATALFAMAIVAVLTLLIWRTATHVERAGQEVRRSEARLRQLANLVPQFVWVRDAQGRLEFVNQQWTEFTGLSLEQSANPEISLTVFHPDDRDAFFDRFSAAIARGTQYEMDARIRSTTGEYRWFLIRSEPARETPESPVTGWYGTATDITPQREMLAAERREREAAEHESRIKDDFLATLSHELRTPLTAIVGWSDMLRKGVVPPDRVDHAIHVIFANATRQRALIEDLLDMSRIVSGHMRLQLTTVSVEEAVRAAVDVVQPAADARGIRVHVDTARAPVTCRADAGRLHQVLCNLLTNAVKFTPAGGDVAITADADVDSLRITVRDTGIGIAPEFLPHVFELFKQADSAPTREYGGLGLGLAIARSLVVLHGGDIRASSGGAGRGTTFVVSLPQDSAAVGAPATAGPRRVAGPLAAPSRVDEPT